MSNNEHGLFKIGDITAGLLLGKEYKVYMDGGAEYIRDEINDVRYVASLTGTRVYQQKEATRLTGGSSNYYVVNIVKPTRETVEPYTAECNDIIEALNMSFAEGNAFKAIWRSAAARQGNGKPGTTALYDAEKVEFFGKRMISQYLDLCERVINEGVWVENARTGKRCLTVINADLEYDLSENKLPILTTKKSYWKQAITEMIGYLRGYTFASQFRAIGCKTWDANANQNEAWLNNPHRRGPDDMGRCYGAQGRDWKNPEGESIDQLRNVYEDLRKGVDNRSEIMTFMNPGERDRACLNSCMHTHTFSILDGTLYLTSYQRSDDLPLGHGFNQIQVGWLLLIMAQITGLKPGKAYHKIVNAHIYEDQLAPLRDIQLKREPFESPTLYMNPAIRTLEDLEDWVTVDDFGLEGYVHHEPIKYAFSV